MNRKILTVLLVVSMVSVCIPAVFAIPDQPTKEEEKEIIEKYIERQSESKGWFWISLPNVNPNTASNNDICPELKKRAQYNLDNLFKVNYSIECKGSAFYDSWHDNLTTDQDTGVEELEEIMSWSDVLYPGDNYFITGSFSVDSWGYWDMNVNIDIMDEIDTNHDSNLNNNHDEEYRYFLYY